MFIFPGKLKKQYFIDLFQSIAILTILNHKHKVCVLIAILVSESGNNYNNTIITQSSFFLKYTYHSL